MRKPVAAFKRGDWTQVVCDDGTVWTWNGGVWLQNTPPVPGTHAEQELTPENWKIR